MISYMNFTGHLIPTHYQVLLILAILHVAGNVCVIFSYYDTGVYPQASKSHTFATFVILTLDLKSLTHNERIHE